MSINPQSSSRPDGKRILPRRFGRYSLFDFIGKGGMAEIYLARAVTEFGGARLCVVKQIIPEFSGHPDFAAMLIHEAKLAAQLNHANIVQVFDLGRDADQLYIAMEYVEGYDLNALLKRCSQFKVPMPAEFAFAIVLEVLKALDYAHRRTNDEGKPLGIVHRDVSPSNILISLEGEVKLCDFGIAHANDLVAENGAEMDDAIKGKAGYMSPEHARGDAIDARADVFAAGIVLWELVAGRRFYKNEVGKPALIEQARRAEVLPLPDRGLAAMPTLQKVLDRALAKDRDERYPSAAAMLRGLENYIAEARYVASPLKLGDWMIDKFGTATVKTRRSRERAVAALERGPAAIITPLFPAPNARTAPDLAIAPPARLPSEMRIAVAPLIPADDLEPPSSLAAVQVGPESVPEPIDIAPEAAQVITAPMPLIVAAATAPVTRRPSAPPPAPKSSSAKWIVLVLALVAIGVALLLHRSP